MSTETTSETWLADPYSVDPATLSIPDKIGKLDVLREKLPTQNRNVGSFTRMLTIAESMRQIRHFLDADTMRPIMDMMNTRLGFQTDKDPKKSRKVTQTYRMETVRECVIEATLRGVEICENQFNIIAGNCYITKEGFQYLFKKIPGLTDRRVHISLPQVKNGQTSVVASASWKLDGKEDSTGDVELAIKTDDYTTPDAVRGKAERKILKYAYEIITGNVIEDGDAGEAPQIRDVTAPRIEKRETAPVSEQAEPEPEMSEAEAIAEITRRIAENKITSKELGTVLESVGLRSIEAKPFMILNDWQTVLKIVKRVREG